MVDVIRMLLQDIITYTVIIGLIWLIALIIKKNIEPEYHKTLGVIKKYLILGIVLIFLINIIYFASTNCIPRSTPNYQERENGTKNFEKRIQKESEKEKK
jgi:hypothetical protein